MTSRADDFGVRHDEDDRRRAARDDYDLGYADGGWDTQGFRSPSPAGGYRTDGYRTDGYRTDGADGRYDPYATQSMGGAPAQSSGAVPTQSIGAAPTQQISAPPTRQPQRHASPTRRHGGPAGPGGPRRPRGRGGDNVKVKGSWWRHWTWRKVVGLLAALVGAFIVLIVIAVIYVYQHTPVPTEEMAAAVDTQSIVYADDGKTVIGRFGDTDRQVLSYNQIPSKIIWAALAAEDRNFFNEGAVSPTGIMRAAYDDITGSGGSLQGGSTITQQFVRNYYQGIGTDQTASRKIKEIFVALKISRSESKQWILENYLNTIYLGESSYGIAAAAQTYFGLPVSKLQDITWSQAALLAAVIQQPSTYPLPQYRADFESRWDYVVQGLVKMGKLTPQFASTLKFPAFGDNIPHTYGNAVWDPYVLDVVQNELEEVDGLSQSELYNDGYKIVTTVDPAKMDALYQSVQTEEDQMTEYGESFQSYMHVGAVLENPQTGAIEAMYGGPGYPGYKYNGVGKVITQQFCKEIYCTDNMAVYNREQVGSSFKPYILSTAVSEGMNVQTSKLDGNDFACIPPDSEPSAFPQPDKGFPANDCPAEWYPMANDSPAENGVYTPQNAMTNSVNTAYADLWHAAGGAQVVQMAANYGVNTVEAGLAATDNNSMENEAGVALGQASLTVGEQATMLATIDDEGVWHQIHIVQSISQSGVSYTTKLQPQRYVLDPGNPTVNQNMDSQVQYGMENVVLAGTGTAAEMEPARPIISKTGTTNTAQSAFFIGAIPQEALAVAIFTNEQGKGTETLNGLGGVAQGDGGTWPAEIWHAYAQQMFIQLSPEQFLSPVFTGKPWILVPANLLKQKAKHKPKKQPDVGVTGSPVTAPSAYPTPTQTCPPGQAYVNCVAPAPTDSAPGNGTMQTPTPTTSSTVAVVGGLLSPRDSHGTGGGGASAGAAVAGSVVALPLALFWVRKRGRRGNRRG